MLQSYPFPNTHTQTSFLPSHTILLFTKRTKNLLNPLKSKRKKNAAPPEPSRRSKSTTPPFCLLTSPRCHHPSSASVGIATLTPTDSAHHKIGMAIDLSNENAYIVHWAMQNYILSMMPWSYSTSVLATASLAPTGDLSTSASTPTPTLERMTSVLSITTTIRSSRTTSTPLQVQVHESHETVTEIEHVRVVTLNRTRQLNTISPKLVDPICSTSLFIRFMYCCCCCCCCYYYYYYFFILKNR